MRAINFNWGVNKMQELATYNFTATICRTSTQFDCTVTKNAGMCTVTIGEQTNEVVLFRENMTVRDVLALAFCCGVHVESGNAPYKCDILHVEAPTNDGYSEEIFRGIGQYHSHTYQARTDCPYFYGIELETVARNERAFYALKGFESNCWYMERDGSLPSYGIEFISTLIRPQDATNPAFFEPLCDTLTGLAKSATIEATGLHFHVSRTAFGDTEAEQLETVAKVSELLETLIPATIVDTIFGRSCGTWCKELEKSDFTKAVATVKRVAGGSILKDSNIKEAYIKDLTKYNRVSHGYRYFRINLTNSNTFEFRQGKGTINSTKIATIAQFIDTLIKYARITKFEKLSKEGYIRSIPSTNKYQRLKDYFSAEE